MWFGAHALAQALARQKQGLPHAGGFCAGSKRQAWPRGWCGSCPRRRMAFPAPYVRSGWAGLRWLGSCPFRVHMVLFRPLRPSSARHEGDLAVGSVADGGQVEGQRSGSSVQAIAPLLRDALPLVDGRLGLDYLVSACLVRCYALC